MRRRALLWGLLALAAGGCAFNDPANTPLLTALDKAVQPETTWGKISLGAVFVPVGAVCGVLDIAVVHPAHSLYLAGGRTRQDLWVAPDAKFGERALLFVPNLLLTPFVFGGHWLGYALFDLRVEEEQKEAK